MDIKLIALDLDGTLLDEKKHLSEKNRKVLMRCIEKGIFVVPTTGRTVIGIPKEVLSIPGVRYAITVNGAMVEDFMRNCCQLKRHYRFWRLLKSILLCMMSI